MVVTLSAVTACAPAPKLAAHSVAYYRTHPVRRREMLARCANDPGEEGRTPECTNARAAARIAGIGSLRRLPPMGLPGAGSRR